MADKTLNKVLQQASPTLKRVILNTERRPSYEQVKNLRSDDVDLLRSFLKDKKIDPSVQLDKVVSVLSECDQSEETANILKSILADAQRSVALRTVVATKLADMPAEIAESALLKQVNDSNTPLVHRCLMSLAKVGSEQTLQELKKIGEPSQAALRRQWNFCQRLIRHRLGMARGLELRETGSNWNTEMGHNIATLPVEAIDATRLAICAPEIQRQIKDIPWATDRGLTISSDGLTTHVFLNKNLATRSGRHELGKAPAVAAAIAMWDERAQKPVVEQLALIAPFEQGLLIQGYRLDGVQAFEGYATLDDGDLSFTLTSTDHAGQCRFRAEGYVRAEGLMLQAQSLQRISPRTTRALSATV